jgi:hypothetical protein
MELFDIQIDGHQKMIPDHISFLLSQGGPILRWRTATELIAGTHDLDQGELQAELLACAEVRRWLTLLGRGSVHHSMDASAENALAKLCEYGLRAGMKELDERARPYCAVGYGERYHEEALIIVPFLVRAGFASEPRVASWMAQRIELLHEQACRADYDFYMDETEAKHLPAGQKTMHGSPKHFYQQRFNNHWGFLGLPTCYDLYALAYLPKDDPLTCKKVETIITYLLNPAFQDTPGGYIWNPKLHRPYAAGRVLLACLPSKNEHEKLVLFMEMMAQFECGRSSDWFLHGMAELESFRLEGGTYRFPRAYLNEKSSYYLYAGMHMGLGELPRNDHALKLESTFRMERLKKLAFSVR